MGIVLAPLQVEPPPLTEYNVISLTTTCLVVGLEELQTVDVAVIVAVPKNSESQVTTPLLLFIVLFPALAIEYVMEPEVVVAVNLEVAVPLQTCDGEDPENTGVTGCVLSTVISETEVDSDTPQELIPFNVYVPER